MSGVLGKQLSAALSMCQILEVKRQRLVNEQLCTAKTQYNVECANAVAMAVRTVHTTKCSGSVTQEWSSLT